MIQNNIKFPLFVITLLIGSHAYGMKRKRALIDGIQKSVVSTMSLNDLHDDILQQVGTWIPIGTAKSLACTNKSLYHKFNTPYWTKQFIDAFTYTPMNLTTLGAIKYYAVNDPLMEVCLTSTHHGGYDVDAYTKLFENPYADPDYVCKESQRSLLMVASTQLCLPLIEALVKKGASVNLYSAKSREYSPICCAIKSTHLIKNTHENTLYKKQTIEYLIQSGANIKHTNPAGTNYLHEAAAADPSLVSFLLTYYLDPNAFSQYNTTPLLQLMAILSLTERPGGLEAMEALLVAGANPYTKSGLGDTFLTVRRLTVVRNREFEEVLTRCCAGRDAAWYDAQQQLH